MEREPKSYFFNIEEKLIDEINNANSSIIIAVAWFTSKILKDALISKKVNNPNLIIEIIVDNNKINDKYFFNYEDQFLEVGIILKEKVQRRFLHNKFIIIDEKIVINGSYNFSKNAKSNLENIIINYSERISKNFKRQFEYITQENYIDENVKLLFRYPEFAQKMLSTYYEFTQKEYKKYSGKIKLGYCFTHPNGFSDELKYEPGLIFNKKVKLEPRIRNEFKLPIQKSIIKNWLFHNSLRFNYESHLESAGDINDEEFWSEFSSDMEGLDKYLNDYFKRKEDNTFNANELEKMIVEQHIDIVIEDDLWSSNFQPYLNKQIVEELFLSFNNIKKQIGFLGNYEEAPNLKNRVGKGESHP